MFLVLDGEAFACQKIRVTMSVVRELFFFFLKEMIEMRRKIIYLFIF